MERKGLGTPPAPFNPQNALEFVGAPEWIFICVFNQRDLSFAPSMSNFNADGGSENQWEDRGELEWNEFDWERYLREQDEAVQRYAKFYEASRSVPDRIDKVAEKMNWGQQEWTDESGSDADDDDDEDDDDSPEDVYTLQKNPIFIASKAICLCLGRSWEELAADSTRVPQPLAVSFLASLHRCEEQSVQALHALDFGDYAMAVSLLKRAMAALNATLALLNDESINHLPSVRAWREEAFARFFDLREIWLRVIAECRDELTRPSDEEG